MAVSIPREVFTLGAVQFDTSRLANLEGQILAKREAKRQAEQEAIDKYLMDLGGKLTPTGVRTDDLPGFEARRKAWTDFSMNNKSEIKSNPLVRAQADKLYNDALSYIQASKNEEEKAKAAKNMLVDPSKRNQLNTRALIEDISLHDRPLDDPDRKSIDYNAAWYRDPSFDFIKEFSEAAKGQPKSFLRVIPESQNKILGTVSTEEGWTPKSINAIADNFVRSVRDNPDKYEYYVRRAKTLSPADLADLNKELVGTGMIADDDDPLAVAYADVLRQARSAIDVVQKPDTELQQKRAMERSAARAAQEEKVQGNAFDEIDFENMVKGVQFAQDFTGTIPTKGDKLPQSVKSALSAIGYNIDSEDDVEVKMKDGQVIEIKAKGNSPVSRNTMMNAQLKFSTEPLKGQQMTFGQPTKTKVKKGELD